MTTVGSVYSLVMTTHVARMAAAVSEVFHQQADTTDPLFRRVGVFCASTQFIANDPELFRRILAEVVVIRAEAMVWPDEIVYIGYSEHFDLVEQGATPPTYMVTCHRHQPGIDPAGVLMPATTTFKFVRQEAQ